MNVSALAASTLISGLDSSSRVTATTQRSLDRVGQQGESARVQLSSVSQVKSATAGVEAAASKLQSSTGLDTLGKVQKAVTAFADAFNGQQQAASKAGSANPALRQAGNDLRQAAQGVGGGNESALRSIGITVSRDGGIKVDAKQLEKAYQANPNQVTDTLKQIGQGVEKAAKQQLADNGSVGSSYNRLNQRVGNLEQKQADYQAGFQQSQQTVDERNRQLQQAQATSGIAASAIRAYQGVISL